MWQRISRKKMVRFLAAGSGGNPYDSGVDVGSSGGLFLLCAVVVSLSIISMIVFACADGIDRRRWAGGGGGGGACGGGGGGGCG
ncbi:hypothetical protein Ancab_011147, partial [Ancistrocladus abbreviatus]